MDAVKTDRHAPQAFYAPVVTPVARKHQSRQSDQQADPPLLLPPPQTMYALLASTYVVRTIPRDAVGSVATVRALGAAVSLHRQSSIQMVWWWLRLRELVLRQRLRRKVGRVRVRGIAALRTGVGIAVQTGMIVVSSARLQLRGRVV